MDVKLKWVYRDRDRHGNVRVYFWRGGGSRKVRIREVPGTPEFLARYNELVEEAETGRLRRASVHPLAASPGTFGWLIARYKSECAA